MAAGGNYTVQFQWRNALWLVICCILPLLVFHVFPENWVCGGLCDEQLQTISGTVSGQEMLDTPCPFVPFFGRGESICWKGVLELRYELPPGQNHTCSLRVIKNSPTPSNIEFAYKIKWPMSSTINATIESRAHDHCFHEAELEEMRNERNSPIWDGLRFMSTLIVGCICAFFVVAFFVEAWHAGQFPCLQFDYNTLNVQDLPQEADEEAKML